MGTFKNNDKFAAALEKSRESVSNCEMAIDFQDVGHHKDFDRQLKTLYHSFWSIPLSNLCEKNLPKLERPISKSIFP